MSAFNLVDFVQVMRMFRNQWSMWMQQCYPKQIIDDPKEANQRFAEEAIEAMQAFDMSKEEVLRVVNYVYSREKGEPAQEAAGVLNCLVTLCDQREIDLGQAAVDDLHYCWANLGDIKAKNALKPRFDLPVVEPKGLVNG